MKFPTYCAAQSRPSINVSFLPSAVGPGLCWGWAGARKQLQPRAAGVPTRQRATWGCFRAENQPAFSLTAASHQSQFFFGSFCPFLNFPYEPKKYLLSAGCAGLWVEVARVRAGDHKPPCPHRLFGWGWGWGRQGLAQ